MRKVKRLNREIKFRAWNEHRKEMYYQGKHFTEICLVHNEIKIVLDETVKNNENWYRRKYELMQYTGLKDNNDKEIYEGDIVRVTYKKAAPKYKIQDRKVIFNDGAYWLTNSEGTSLTRLSNVSVLFDVISNVESLEVIGNIYENPELLEVNKNE